MRLELVSCNELTKVSVCVDQPCEGGRLSYGGCGGLLYGSLLRVLGERGLNVPDDIDFCKKVVYRYNCIRLHGTVIIIDH